MNSYDPAGKFHRISTGDLPLPAICGGCGKIEDPEGFVDTALNRIRQLEEAIISKDATIASLERGLDGITATRLTDRGINVVSDPVIPTEPEPLPTVTVNDSGTSFVESILAESVTSAGPVHPTKPERSDPIIDL